MVKRSSVSRRSLPKRSNSGFRLYTHSVSTGMSQILLAPNLLVVQCGGEVLVGAAGTRIKEKLADLLLESHGGDGLLHPLDALVIQGIRFCLQFYHMIHFFGRRLKVAGYDLEP